MNLFLLYSNHDMMRFANWLGVETKNMSKLKKGYYSFWFRTLSETPKLMFPFYWQFLEMQQKAYKKALRQAQKQQIIAKQHENYLYN